MFLFSTVKWWSHTTYSKDREGQLEGTFHLAVPDNTRSGADNTTVTTSAGSTITSAPFPAIKTQEVTVGQIDTMNYQTGMDGYTAMNSTSFSRTREKEELQRLNERFASYVQRVRQQSDHNNQIDSTALMRSTKLLDDEIHNIKNLYETELEKLRRVLFFFTVTYNMLGHRAKPGQLMPLGHCK